MTFSLCAKEEEVFSYSNYDFSKFTDKNPKGEKGFVIRLVRKKGMTFPSVHGAAETTFPGRSVFRANYKKMAYWGEENARRYVFTRKGGNCSDFFVKFDPDASSAQVLANQPKPVQNPFDFLPKWKLEHYLCRRRQGALIHGSCAVIGGKAFLFVGPSGSGKTTIARFCLGRGFAVLNDENVILRKSGDGWRAYGTPWSRTPEMVRNASAKIERIFFLRFGKRNQIKQVSRREALRRLPPNILLYGVEGGLFGHMWELVDELSKQNIFSELIFKRSPAFLDLLA